MLSRIALLIHLVNFFERPPLVFGSLNGGSPTIFAYISDGTQLSIVGWTTM
jgi:hypothetical protein